MDVWVPGGERQRDAAWQLWRHQALRQLDCKYLVPGAVTGDILCLTVMLRLPVLQI